MFRPFRRKAMIVIAALLLLPSAAPGQPPSGEWNCDDLDQLKAKAEHNDDKALLTLSSMYFKGECVDKDEQQGFKLLGQSARLGNSRALFLTAGIAHKGGEDDQALKFAQRAAEKGDPEAQWFTAFLYDSGKGIVNDDEEAAKWAKRSAEQGNVTAQVLLGGFYFDGRGVARDYVEADKWWILALREKDDEDWLKADQESLDKQLSRRDAAEAHRRADAWKATPEPQRD